MFLPARPIYDLARPGYALFGGNPTPAAPNPMRPVVTLTVAVQQTRWIEAGETCGYNAQWTARRRTRLATLLAGYADGLPRGAGATDAKPGAEVMLAGRRCPLVGRISMDLCVADVTDLPEEAARPGRRAEFFGAAADLDDFATKSGTIGYQVLTGLGRRYRREYFSTRRRRVRRPKRPGCPGLSERFVRRWKSVTPSRATPKRPARCCDGRSSSSAALITETTSVSSRAGSPTRRRDNVATWIARSGRLAARGGRGRRDACGRHGDGRGEITLNYVSPDARFRGVESGAPRGARSPGRRTRRPGMPSREHRNRASLLLRQRLRRGRSADRKVWHVLRLSNGETSGRRPELEPTGRPRDLNRSEALRGSPPQCARLTANSTASRSACFQADAGNSSSASRAMAP